MAAVIERALSRLRVDVTRGISDSNVQELVNRLNDDAITRPFQDAIVGQIQAVALAGSEFGREQVERDIYGVKAAGVGMWEMANNAAAEWALRYGYELVTGLLSTTRQRLQVEIAEYVRNSETIGQLMKRLSAGGVFGEDRAMMIAVTEVTRAFAEGNIQAWKASGVIEKVRWNTNNDEIVAECPICFPMNGKVTEIGKGWEHPDRGAISIPAHPRCRCWATPVVE